MNKRCLSRSGKSVIARHGRLGRAIAETLERRTLLNGLSFATAVTTSPGNQPEAVVAVDVNHDGRQDIVEAGYFGSVTVLLSNGDGTFQAARTYSDGLPDAVPTVTAADLTGDGNIDLLLTTNKGRDVSILLGNGDGSFAPATLLATPHQTLDLAVGDVNGDGKADLLVLNYNGTISEFPGNGDGTFQAPSTIQIDGNAGTDQIVLADFNGDGELDVAVANTDYQTVTILLGNGSGGFTPTGTEYHVSDLTTMIEGDFNGDGRADLAIGTGTGNVELLLGNGDGTFATVNSPGLASGGIVSMAAADFDGDGRLDLLVSTSNTERLYLGNGDGTFESVSAYSAQANVTGINAVVAADLSGTGRPDLVIGEVGAVSEIIAVPNTTTGGLFFAPATSVTVGGNPTAIATGDLNDDGKIDLVEANTSGDTIRVRLGNGDGTFLAPHSYTVPNNPSAILIADMNGDGIPDIVVASAQSGCVSILLGNGDGTFKAAVTRGVRNGVAPGNESIAVGDFNGDGFMDVAVADGGQGSVSLLLGNNTASLAAAVTAFTFGEDDPGTIGALVSGDFNNDGRPDLAVVDSDYNNIDVILNNGGGSFGSYSSYHVDGEINTISALPVIGTSKVDLVVADQLNDNLVVLPGNGDGTFGPAQTYAAGGIPLETASGDLNGDGVSDIVALVADGAGYDVKVFAGYSDGGFGNAHPFVSGNVADALAIADFNGDGRPDIVTADGANSAIHVLLNTTNTMPVIINANHATFNVGTLTSFTISTAGFPTPTVSFTNALPNGVSFVDNDNGTATISGTPAIGTGGVYVINLDATNGIAPDASQFFTLTVDEGLAFTSVNSATFASGSPVSFTITTLGFPIPTITTDSDLPPGLTLIDNGNGTATLSGTPTGTENTYPIDLTADNDSDSVAQQTLTIAVVQPMIQMMSGGMVMATASDQNDTATIGMTDGMLSVDIDGDTQTFAMNSVTAVQVDLGSGDDNLMISSAVPVPVSAGGGPGNDTIMAMNSMPDSVRGGGGNDSVMGSTTASDMIRGGMGNDTLMGGGDGTMLLGNPGADVIDPSSAGITVRGGGGNDTVTSASTGDVLFGGPGDDVILNGGDSGNYINGGAGLNFAQNNPNDTMFNITAVIDPPAPVIAPVVGPTVASPAGEAPAADSEVTSVVVGTVLSIFGTSGADSISVTLDGSNLIVGGSGSGSFPVAALTGISIDGFGGNDTISVDPSVALMATLSGGAGNDSISAGGGSAVLIAGAGNDTLVGGTGTSLLVPGNLNVFSSAPSGNDLLEGGSGFAIADFSYRTDPLHLSNDGQPDSGDSLLDEHTTIMPSVLGIWGGTASDTIVGTVAGEFISGGSGPDSITGGGADDLIVGGLGKDTVHVAAEPVTLYMRDGKVDQITGVDDQEIDVLQIDVGLDVLS